MLSRPGAVREFDRRAGAARQHYQGWESESAPGADRGRLDLSLSGSDEPSAARAPGVLASGRAAIAWKAQLRLCARYRRLMAAGKRQTVVTTAIAREMAAFLWAIGREIEPRSAA